jgi:hypothetical protein
MYIKRSVDVIYPTVIIDDVSMKRYPKSVSNFLYLDFVLSGGHPYTHADYVSPRWHRTLDRHLFPPARSLRPLSKI